MKELRKERNSTSSGIKLLIICAILVGGRMIVDLFGLYILLGIVVLTVIPRWVYLIGMYIYLRIEDLFHR